MLTDQHLVLSRRHQLQLDEPGRGREGDDVDGLARSLEEVFRDGEDDAVVGVRGQLERALEHRLAPVLVRRRLDAVLSGGALERDLGVLREYRSFLHQAVASAG